MNTFPVAWRSGRVLWAVSAMSLLLAAVGCSRSGGPGVVPPAPEVTVAAVDQEEMVEWEEFTGRTDAVERVEIRPRVSGHVEEVRFQSGQWVKKGDVLFVIDPRWHQAEFDRREAEYEQAKVRMENAEREAARTQALLERKAISAEEADQRQARYSEARAGLLAAKAARDFASLDLEHTRVRSPIDGRVSRALVTVGNYVGGAAGASNLLTTVVSMDPIYVYADMDENALLRFNVLDRAGRLVRDGQGRVPVELQLGNEEGYQRQGYIESFDNQLNPQTGSIVVRAVFANPDGRAVPGLFARIRVPAGPRAPVLLVDEMAIGTDQAQKFVLTVTATNTAAYRPVKLGARVGGRRVVLEGLKAGEKIVVNGMARVRPGMPVKPVERVSATPGAGGGAAGTGGSEGGGEAGR